MIKGVSYLPHAARMRCAAPRPWWPHPTVTLTLTTKLPHLPLRLLLGSLAHWAPTTAAHTPGLTRCVFVCIGGAHMLGSGSTDGTGRAWMSPDLGQRGSVWAAVTDGYRTQSGGRIAVNLSCAYAHQLQTECVAAAAGTGSVSV